MTHERLTYLLNQFTGKEMVEDERNELKHFLDGLSDNDVSEELVRPLLEEKLSGPSDHRTQITMENVLQSVFAVDKPKPLLRSDEIVEVPQPYIAARSAHRVHFLREWSWAAAIILVSSIGAYFLATNKKNKATTVTTQTVVAIRPGINRALLTIGNARPIDLSDNKTGIVVGAAITYNDGERIADAGQILQLATPRGGQYQAVLPDGTKVWLNAASSIRFPAKFAPDKREVEVSGEVYMEVAQNNKQPFSVKTGGTWVQVLGTSFNINAYPDEGIQRTTLISGIVKVLAASHSEHPGIILKPGQTAITGRDEEGKIKVSNANIDWVLAWKNGFINFESGSFQEVMRQIERWYDIDVKFEGAIAPVRIEGRMDRGVQLSDLMGLLNNFGIRTRLEGRTLILGGN